MRASWLLNVRFSWKPALSLIYRSFECCDTSTALYSAKLTVHFIHNNRHHCRHFDLDMSWNPISKWILLMDYYTPLLCFLHSSPIWQIKFRVKPPFCFTLKIHTGIHGRIWLVEAWRHAACWLELDEDCILMGTDITLTLALSHRINTLYCPRSFSANPLWFSA